MDEERQTQARLFQYLLWGNCSDSPRFLSLAEFEAWAATLGFDPESCRNPWGIFEWAYPDKLLL
jgi:hypothetical protein